MNLQTPLLVFDVHYLAHRAFHSTCDLSYHGKATGVIFGFLQSIGFLKDDFQTDRVVFCFEHKHLKRRDIFPSYKERRHTSYKPPEELKAMGELNAQIAELRQRYLPKIGFNNVFAYDGYESDDVMAAIARDYGKEQEVVIVTADLDLLQCLSPKVSIYSPQKKKLLTELWFYREYGISPAQWALVKALAGCSGDCVPGIKGVGEVTALKWIKGELSKTSKAWKLIESKTAAEIVLRNQRLVELPFEDCPTPKIVEDEVTKAKWEEVMEELGMHSLAGKPPIATHKLTRYVEER